MLIPVSIKERVLDASPNEQDLRLVINAMANDIITLKTQLQAALVKLDSDNGVQDTNYAATIGTAATTYYVSA